MVWIWLTDKEFQHPRLIGVVVNREQILCLSTKSRPFHLGSWNLELSFLNPDDTFWDTFTYCVLLFFDELRCQYLVQHYDSLDVVNSPKLYIIDFQCSKSFEYWWTSSFCLTHSGTPTVASLKRLCIYTSDNSSASAANSESLSGCRLILSHNRNCATCLCGKPFDSSTAFSRQWNDKFSFSQWCSR